MGKKDMDDQTSEALLYRIQQLENAVKRAQCYAGQMELTLQGVIGTLKVTKGDFEHLRNMCK